MIKKAFGILLTFGTLYFILQNIQRYVLDKKEIFLPYSLDKVYLFHAGFSTLLCVNILLLSSVNKFKEQLGLIYLIALFVKIVLFFATFYKSILKINEMQPVAKISMLVPTLIFLSTEVVFIAKQIRQKS